MAAAKSPLDSMAEAIPIQTFVDCTFNDLDDEKDMEVTFPSSYELYITGLSSLSVDLAV